MIRSALVLALVAATTTGFAQKGVPWWHAAYEAALEEARLRNVPILVAFIQDDEEANDRIVAGLYTDPAFIRLATEIIPIICCRGTHAPRKETIDGRDEAVCSKFGRVSCAMHQKHEIEGRAMFWESKRVTTPHHVVCLPDGTEVARLQDVHPTGAYESAVREARKRLGPGLGAADFRTAKAELERSRKALEEGVLAEAIAGLLAFEAAAATAPFAEKGKALRSRIEARAEADLRAAQEAWEAGDLTEALRRSQRGAAEYARFGPDKAFVGLAAEIAKTAEGRRAKAALDREARAIPVLEGARAAEARRDYVKAVREYARVEALAPGSPPAEEAGRRLEALAQDPDVARIAAGPLEEWRGERGIREAMACRERGDHEAARVALERVISELPKTQAARRAQRLLESGR
jgi:hypothetical protein